MTGINYRMYDRERRSAIGVSLSWSGANVL